jgi:hypothetical protein
MSASFEAYRVVMRVVARCTILTELVERIQDDEELTLDERDDLLSMAYVREKVLHPHLRENS